MRVERTFAFLDLSGFTSFMDTRGDAEAGRVLARLRAIVRTEAEELGVRLTKWLGDGAMLSGIEPETVVTCALQIRERVDLELPLPIRGGICMGRVIMFEGDDYIGPAVNIAARLCDAAPPGTLLATAETARVARAPAEPGGTLLLAGIAKPVEQVSLIGVRPTAASALVY